MWILIVDLNCPWRARLLSHCDSLIPPKADRPPRRCLDGKPLTAIEGAIAPPRSGIEPKPPRNLC
ncbi:hypothetical protein AMR42_11570 [Limnothrix sp. PR1529]|nr:hypothetical protein BCR12_03015 [Limnothrix sp. P13C2]PIB09896.1 hypothetical protein AMR42_11570 [Limnothrix sp. PR1529]